MSRLLDLTGKRFGRLLVRSRVGTNTPVQWKCKCDCGKTTIVVSQRLREGQTKSCGCFHKEVITKHGKHNSATYKVWENMLTRCRNPNTPFYKDYGGRGIRVCKRWLAFSNFLADMGERPKGLTLDRRNTNGHYCPSNCRWISSKLQLRNRRPFLRRRRKEDTKLHLWDPSHGTYQYIGDAPAEIIKGLGRKL